jgi:hypothetical protein
MRRIHVAVAPASVRRAVAARSSMRLAGRLAAILSPDFECAARVAGVRGVEPLCDLVRYHLGELATGRSGHPEGAALQVQQIVGALAALAADPRGRAGDRGARVLVCDAAIEAAELGEVLVRVVEAERLRGLLAA